MNLIRNLSLAGVAALALFACDKSDTAPASETNDSKKNKSEATDEDPLEQLNKRCEALAKGCGELDKHQAKITEECKAVATKQIEKRCGDAFLVAYECYEKDICQAIKKVWALDDFRVLTKRHNKCVEARAASFACMGDKDEM